MDDACNSHGPRVVGRLQQSWHQQTIVFCYDQDHAARMREKLVNLNSDLLSRYGENWVVRMEKYAAHGPNELAPEALRTPLLSEMGTPAEVAQRAFGGPRKMHDAIDDLAQRLYAGQQPA